MNDTAPVSGRDPRRSLILGAAIAGVVLAVLAAAVLAGALIVMWPRRADRGSLGVRPAPAIHQLESSAS